MKIKTISAGFPEPGTDVLMIPENEKLPSFKKPTKSNPGGCATYKRIKVAFFDEIDYKCTCTAEVVNDAMTYGVGVSIDGKHVPLEEFLKEEEHEDKQPE